MPVFTEDQLYGLKGHMKTRALFKETCSPKDTPLMELKKRAHNELPCLRDYYINLCVMDPTEADFAEEVFGDIIFWENLKKTEWFAPYYEEYKRTADIKRKSIAFKSVFAELHDGKNALSAAKFLIQEGYVPREEKTRAKRKEIKETTQEAVKATPYKGDLSAFVN